MEVLWFESPFLKLSPTPLWVNQPELPQVASAKSLILDGYQSMDETRIEKMILTLSSYNNRYYTSATGEESAKWIANQWSHLTQNRSDAEVTLFEHSWAQPSVILKIKGSGNTNEALVLGGHLDSIAGFSAAAERVHGRR